MQYRDLRDFIRGLEQRGELKRIQVPISPVLEMTEVCDRTLRAKGPALLFEKPTGFDIPVLGNLFGTPERVAMGMGAESVERTARNRQVAGLPQGARAAEGPEGRLVQAADLQESRVDGTESGQGRGMPGSGGRG